ncbi:hypothetical protein ABT389_24610 [Streptomyces bacillaris]|uniref:hypothetical protein n=1 Tax=Streptomyces bacillaris TaxID=68179 RepID=UPI00334FF760
MEFHDRLRRRIRERAGRDPEPIGSVIDSQSVKVDAVVGAYTHGFDGGKLINGRRCHAAIAALGRLMGVKATSAGIVEPEAEVH